MMNKIVPLQDTDPMPFGKHEGKPMENVPASYLLWLWDDGCNHAQVSEYIERNLNALEWEQNRKDRDRRCQWWE